MPIELPINEIQFNVPDVWSYVATVRQMIVEAVSQRAPALAGSAGLVASELVENAIKYGEPVAAASHASFRLTMNDTSISIEVRNGIRNIPAVEAYKERLAKIAASPNKEQLCLERMQELINHPNQHGQLGLYRIVQEASFDLSCTYENEVLIVRAKRAIE